MRIILIGGAQRSGTTLVQTLIANALPNAPILPEAHILFDLLRAWQQAKSEWPKTSRFYTTRDQAARFFHTAVDSHIGDIGSRYPGAENFVLKEPHLIETLTEVAEFLPAATRIVCVRDPRDIVASYLKIGGRQIARKMESRYSRRDIDFICKKINQSYSPFMEDVLPSDVTIVRYEDVAADPADTLGRIAAETGLPLAPIRPDALVWLEDEYRHQETWRTELEGQAPTTRSVGSFRYLLDHKETRQVERICRPVLDRFSYRTDSKESVAPTATDRTNNLSIPGDGKPAA